MAKAIKVEHLSKAYQLGDFGTGTISRDLERFWAKMRGKEDPFLKIGEMNDRTVKGDSDVVWSLRDLNFEVEQGDAVGIIGRNGAGKSTLLKILSRVTSPTIGSVKVKGRIASLLEVGTGFHPELSGRENIFLNGAILGMRKAEIKGKFDEIVDFSGVERYIDTPVKRYSSGMYVRLAFAVAAHLESEIMIVDEVLAVGDAEFQKKCLGKMGDVRKSEGRTVLFVSHNMGAIKSLCNNAVVMNNGEISHIGPVNDAIKYYLKNQSEFRLQQYNRTEANNLSQFRAIWIENTRRDPVNKFGFDEEIFVGIKLFVNDAHLSSRISMRVSDDMDRIVFTTENDIRKLINKAGGASLRIKIPSNLLVPNRYILTFALHLPNIEMVDLLEDVVSFEVLETGSAFYHHGSDFGCVFVNCQWIYDKISS